MTCCILAGFAKKKKYVGTVYACNGSDLPATQDFGTVQYQGPSETALTVPATTVTYTIIGKTQCGDDIRRITTKTYSSRSNVSGYKTNTPTSWGGDATPNPNQTPVGLGDTSQSAIDNYNARVFAECPTTYSFYTKDYLYRNIILGQWQAIYQPSSHIGWGWEVSASLSTIYYLDVHEVWTYDLV